MANDYGVAGAVPEPVGPYVLRVPFASSATTGSNSSASGQTGFAHRVRRSTIERTSTYMTNYASAFTVELLAATSR